MFGIRRITRQPQGDIRLYRCVQLGRPTIVYVPAAVFELTPPDVVRNLRDAIRARFTNYIKVENVVRFEGSIRFDFSEPVTFRRLERKKIIHAAVDRVVEALADRWKQSGGPIVRWMIKLYANSQSHLYVQTSVSV